MNELVAFLPFVCILCCGIFIQSAAGFAAGLFMIPALLWIGYSIPEAQSSLLVATIPQNLWGVWSFRDAIEPRKVALPGMMRIAFLPLGVLVLRTFESFSLVTIRQFVGGVVLAFILVIMVFRPRPRKELHFGWMWLAFPISGFLQGLVGMGGPPMVFWVQAHAWDTRRTRGFLFAMYLVSLLPAIGFLYGVFGSIIVKPAILTAILIPLLLAVTYLGLKFGTWLGRERLRRVTFGILILMGLSGLAAPLLTSNELVKTQSSISGDR